MKISLRKSTSLLNVTYKTGNFTNNLFGRNFTIEKTNDLNIIGIDFSGNYRVQNKQVNSYADVLEFVEDHDDLEFVQIDESKVIEGLYKAKRDNPDADWRLVIDVDNLGSFNFKVSPKTKDDSLFLVVT